MGVFEIQKGYSTLPKTKGGSNMYKRVMTHHITPGIICKCIMLPMHHIAHILYCPWPPQIHHASYSPCIIMAPPISYRSPSPLCNSYTTDILLIYSLIRPHLGWHMFESSYRWVKRGEQYKLVLAKHKLFLHFSQKHSFLFVLLYANGIFPK